MKRVWARISHIDISHVADTTMTAYAPPTPAVTLRPAVGRGGFAGRPVRICKGTTLDVLPCMWQYEVTSLMQDAIVRLSVDPYGKVVVEIMPAMTGDVYDGPRGDVYQEPRLLQTGIQLALYRNDDGSTYHVRRDTKNYNCPDKGLLGHWLTLYGGQ